MGRYMNKNKLVQCHIPTWDIGAQLMAEQMRDS